MVVTVTLNPAVDKTLFTSRVVMGTVNRIEEAINVPGGKGINVAKVLKAYDKDALCMGFLGGYNGKFIEDSIKEMGLKTDFTYVDGETRTSINLITEDGYVTEYLEPGPLVNGTFVNSFVKKYTDTIKDADMVVISGSIPQGVEPSIYADLINIANDLKKKVVLDTSGEALKKGMYERPFMMKPNMRELENLSGKRLRGMAEVTEAALEIVEWGVPNVMVSMGAKGILYAFEDNGETEVLYAPAPTIKVVNTVGSGDSAVAAFVKAALDGLSKEETLKWAVAVSVANALSQENGIIDKEEVDRIFDQITVSKAIR